MAAFSVIETGGKQYRVAAGDKIQIEKLPGEAGEKISFDTVLLTADGEAVQVGAPYVKSAVVEGIITRQARARKVIIFKYHSKVRYRKKKGHRQEFTEVEIKKV